MNNAVKSDRVYPVGFPGAGTWRRSGRRRPAMAHWAMHGRPDAHFAAPLQSRRQLAGLVVATVLVVAVVAGCPRGTPPPANQPLAADQAADTARHDEALDYALYSLTHLEQYDTPEMIDQIVNRLEQWIRDQQPLPDWHVDPFLDKLPAPLQPIVGQLKLEQLHFGPEDEQWLREAMWLHDISQWVCGKAVEPLAQAEALFDWTVRNIALAANLRMVQKPWETILFGRGTATDRAWVFMLLLRQQGIDSALIAVLERDPSGAQRYTPWAVGVLIDDQMYMFEPTLGVPVPGPNGLKCGADGRLELHPATLEELSRDDSLLRRLDLPGGLGYPITSAQLEKVTALIDVSPAYLAQRMFLLEGKMAGQYQVVLTARPSEQAERIKRCAQVGEVLPWSLPYQIALGEIQSGDERSVQLQVQMMPFMLSIGVTPPLWRARQYHFKGILSGNPSATSYYHMLRIPDHRLEGDEVPSRLRDMHRIAKMFASYWLGVLALEQGNVPSAIDYLKTRTIEAFPDGIWNHAAIYHLGRAYELAGEAEKAIEVYRNDKQSMLSRGNLLRAKWLEQVVLRRSGELQPTAANRGEPQQQSPPQDAAPSGEVPLPAGNRAVSAPADDQPSAAEAPPQGGNGKENGGPRSD